MAIIISLYFWPQAQQVELLKPFLTELGFHTLSHLGSPPLDIVQLSVTGGHIYTILL